MEDRRLGRRLTRRQVLQGAAGGLGLVAGAGMVQAFLIEPGWVEVCRVRVGVRGLPAAFEGYRVGLVSDIHWPVRLSLEEMERVGRLLAGERPDVVCVPGDLVDGHSPGEVPRLRGVFDRFVAPDGAFATLGNHDHRCGESEVRRRVLEETPLRLLDNSHVMIERGGAAICLAGVGDLWDGVVDVAGALRGVAPEVPRIVMSHNPDVAEEDRSGERVDLMVSGHTHGGQVRLPFWSPYSVSRYGDKFRAGLAEGASHRVYVTRGIAKTRAGVRLFARPEVTLLELVGV